MDDTPIQRSLARLAVTYLYVLIFVVYLLLASGYRVGHTVLFSETPGQPTAQVSNS